jgi:hypothetical protein
MHGLELLDEAFQGCLPLLAQLTRHFALGCCKEASQASCELKPLPGSLAIILLQAFSFFKMRLPQSVLSGERQEQREPDISGSRHDDMMMK